MYFDTDVGYVDTGRILAECSLCLSQDKITEGGGYHTPASACGEQLMDRLIRTGCSFNLCR